MSGQASPQRISTAPEPAANAAVEELVRRLAAHALAEMGGPPPAHESGVESVLLDIDVDGARYLLVRLPKIERSRISLSPREQEIVRMVAQGHSNKVIADVLSISSWTVCTHLRRIFAKVGVGSRAAMVARLLDAGGGAPRVVGENGHAQRLPKRA